jgi:hypothetical protein
MRSNLKCSYASTQPFRQKAEANKRQEGSVTASPNDQVLIVVEACRFGQTVSEIQEVF